MRRGNTVIRFWICILGFLLVGAASAADRVALVIGNASYSDRPLRNPGNDAQAMANALKGLGFDVTLHTNLDIDAMDAAVSAFRARLESTRGIGLFYFSGHGAQRDGESYLIPVGKPITDGLQVPRKALATSTVLDLMQQGAKRDLNIVILDACRNWPFASRDKSMAKGFAPIRDSPRGFIIAYATGANATADDGDESLGTYTQALLQEIARDDLSVNDLFQEVSVKVAETTASAQVPAVYASAVPRIYLAGHAQESEPTRLAADVHELVAEEEHIAEAQRQAETVRLAEEERHASEERFVANADGTVTDNQTDTVWAGRDNGNNINWSDARRFCAGKGGGWSLPTVAQLQGLYDSTGKYTQACGGWTCKVTTLIRLSGAMPWSRESNGSSEAWLVDLHNGPRFPGPAGNDFGARALCVRRS